jgi:hypothetical protein
MVQYYEWKTISEHQTNSSSTKKTTGETKRNLTNPVMEGV